MLRRFLAAAIIVILGLTLLVTAWPQLFGLQRAPGVAQLVSLRGLEIAIALFLVLALGFIAVVSPQLRRFTASLAIILLLFTAVTTAVLASRGFGSLAFETISDSSVTVLAWNTLGDAPGASAIATLAIETEADVVALAETTEATGQQVAEAMAVAGRPVQAFTIHFDEISKARSTTLLISETLGSYVVDAAEPNSLVLPTVIARPVDGSGPTIMAVHLVAPIPGEFHHWQQDLEWMASACTGPNVIVAGDFNSTLDHFSGLADTDGASLGECLDAAGTTDNAAVGTWPTSLPALFGAPIDHVMATPNWAVTGMRVIENYDKYGSDHRPILAQLAPAPAGP